MLFWSFSGANPNRRSSGILVCKFKLRRGYQSSKSKKSWHHTIIVYEKHFLFVIVRHHPNVFKVSRYMGSFVGIPYKCAKNYRPNYLINIKSKKGIFYKLLVSKINQEVEHTRRKIETGLNDLNLQSVYVFLNI